MKFKICYLSHTNIGDFMSIWDKSYREHEVIKVSKNITCDVLIIGAGMTGMNTAYFLSDKADICLVEARQYGMGITRNTTAKVTVFQDIIYSKIMDKYNSLIATNYFHSQKEAVTLLRKIIESEKISCDFERSTAYVFATKNNDIFKLNREVKLLKQLGCDIQNITTETGVCYGLEESFVFNPIKYLNELYDILKMKDIPIYENSPITKIERNNDHYISHVNGYKITSNKIVLACHYPFFVLGYILPIRSYLEKSHIIVSESDNISKINYISAGMPVMSSRYYKNFKISLGKSHNLAFSFDDKKNSSKVTDTFDLEESSIIDCYSNVDLITFDYLPFIGKIKPNMFIATGYNTWGMTNSVLAAKIISDMLLDQDNTYRRLFNPKRLNINLLKCLPRNIFSQLKSYFHISKLSPKTCPHMGCKLIYNPIEDIYECPCHSSRFSKDGKLLKGPATKDCE